MNNEKILKKKIQQYLLMPLALTVLLVGMVIVLYVHDKKSGAIAAAAVFIFVVCEIIFFIVMKAAIMPVVFRFALEQGQIQKELLKELDIPYALLDTDGKILWGNAKFIEEIGVGSKKRIRKNISAFFPAVDAEALSSEEMQMDLEYNDRVYRALLRRIDFSEALVDSDEDAMVDHQADAMITLYLYDETELRIYKKENEDQKAEYAWSDVLETCEADQYPKSLLEDCKQEVLQGYYDMAAVYNCSKEDIFAALGYDCEETFVNSDLEPLAEDTAKEYLAAQAIAQKENISYTREELQEYIKEQYEDMTDEYDSPEAFEKDRKGYLERQMLLEQVKNWIADHAKYSS